MTQRGGIALILLIVVVLIGLIVGVYFINQQTKWFSFAGSAQVTIPYASPSVTPKATPIKTASPSAVYENPFEAKADYQNPFDEGYENPFNNL